MTNKTLHTVTSEIHGRHGSYGCTVSVVGCFDDITLAEQACGAFIKEYNTTATSNITRDDLVISSIEINKIDENIVTLAYEGGLG